jgi:hypothetical protein
MPIAVNPNAVIIGIEDLVKDTTQKIVLRNLISKYDNHCSICFKPTKVGQKIKWSRETGPLCHPNCETAKRIEISNIEPTTVVRQFDFGEEDKS